jgi:hypothetical protein
VLHNQPRVWYWTFSRQRTTISLTTAESRDRYLRDRRDSIFRAFTVDMPVTYWARESLTPDESDWILA